MKKFLIAIFSICLILCATSCTQPDNNSSGNEIENITAPIIDTEFEISYGVVNTTIDLPEYTAYFNGEDIDATAVMTDAKGTTIDLANGFTPTKTGEYLYTISAKNGEVETKETVYFYVEENTDCYKNKIASFDKSYGVNHFRQATGIEISYSTDYKYENEVGSTKVSVDSRKGGELYFSLGNFHIKDLTESKGIIFYVYNNNPGHIKLYFNWTNATTLMPHSWNKVYVNESGLQEFEQSYTPLLEKNFSLVSVDGLEIELGQTATADSVYDLYFSALYTLDEDISVNIDSVEELMDEFIFSYNKTQEKINEIELMYNALSYDDRLLVENYNDFRNEVINFYKKNIDLENDKAVYFDNEIGLSQISNVVGASLETSTLYRYGNEQNSTLIDIYGFDAQITIGYPFIDDVSRYDYLTVRFYNPTLSNYVLFNRIGGEDVVLKAKQWTEVNFDLSEVETLNDAVIWIYSGDWHKGLEYGVKIYMSAAYMTHDGNFYSPLELKDAIANITTDISVDELKRLENNYNKYTEQEKLLVDNFNDLINAIHSRILKDEAMAEDNVLLYFDKALGLEQVTVNNATGEYTTKVKLEGENGSTQFDVSGFDLLITLDYVPNIDKLCSTIEFSVYNDNDYDVVFFPDHFVGVKKEVVLAANEWTTVVIDVNDSVNCRGSILWFYSGDWNKGIEGATLYISSVKLNVAEMGEKVVDFTSNTFTSKLTSNGLKSEGSTPEGYAELYYNDEFGFNGDNATVKIVTRSFYSDVVVRDNANIFGCSQIRFAIYNANNVKRMFVDQSRLNGEQIKIWLPANSWTIITLDLAASRASIDGFTFRIYDGGGWGSISGNVFYLTDIYALGRTNENAQTVLNLTAENYSSKLNADLYGGSEGHGTLAFNTNYSFAGHSGSVKLTSHSFYTDIKISDKTAILGYESLRIYVYNANSATHTCRFNGTNVTLAANTWTAVTIDATSIVSLDGIIIRIYKDSGYGSISGHIFYLSDIEGVKGAQEDTATLIDFSSANIPITTSNATLSYDTEYRVGAENGSLKVETKTNSQFYVDLTFNVDVDIREYKSIKFIIYSSYNGLETSGATNVATRYLQTYDTLDANPTKYALAKTSWTVVTVELGENVTSLKDVKIRLFPSGYGKFNGEIFYIADIIGVK